MINFKQKELIEDLLRTIKQNYHELKESFLKKLFFIGFIRHIELDAQQIFNYYKQTSKKAV
jgi:hypothetical protein